MLIDALSDYGLDLVIGGHDHTWMDAQGRGRRWCAASRRTPTQRPRGASRSACRRRARRAFAGKRIAARRQDIGRPTRRSTQLAKKWSAQAEAKFCAERKKAEPRAERRQVPAEAGGNGAVPDQAGGSGQSDDRNGIRPMDRRASCARRPRRGRRDRQRRHPRPEHQSRKRRQAALEQVVDIFRLRRLRRGAQRAGERGLRRHSPRLRQAGHRRLAACLRRARRRRSENAEGSAIPEEMEAATIKRSTTRRSRLRRRTRHDQGRERPLSAVRRRRISARWWPTTKKEPNCIETPETQADRSIPASPRRRSRSARWPKRRSRQPASGWSCRPDRGAVR